MHQFNFWLLYNEFKNTNLILLLHGLFICTDKSLLECGGLQFFIQSIWIGLHESISCVFIILGNHTLIIRLICIFELYTKSPYLAVLKTLTDNFQHLNCTQLHYSEPMVASRISFSDDFSDLIDIKIPKIKS